jgi:rapamycin-insensitive companion of mTOR
VPQGVTFLTLGIVKAVVAVAEMGAQGEDKLGAVAIETLAELRKTQRPSRLMVVVLDTPLVIRAAGLRSLLQTLLDGPPELSINLLYPLLYISDFPSTRRFLYPEPPDRGPSALGVVLSDLTNVVDPVKTDKDDLSSITEEARLRGNAKIIAGMMSSWAGLLALCARSGGNVLELDKFNHEAPVIPTFPGVRSLVDALRVKSSIIRDVLLDLWFEVLNIRIGSWAQNFLAGRRLTGFLPFCNSNFVVFGRPLAYHTTETATDNSSDSNHRTNLLTDYKSLILTVLISSGLLDALASIVETSTSDNQARKATLLLGEILQSAANVLPINYCTRIQSIPRLLSAASRFKVDTHFKAISSIFQIDSLARTKYRATLTPPAPLAKLDEVTGPGAVEQVKLKLGMQLDDAHFRQMVLDTQVLMTSNYTKWQWEKLYELFQGPLMNQKRLDESIKGIRLLPKLFGFYRPSKQKFSKIKKTKVYFLQI